MRIRLAGVAPIWRDRVITVAWFAALMASSALVLPALGERLPGAAAAVALVSCFLFGLVSPRPRLGAALLAVAILVNGEASSIAAREQYDACRASGAVHCEHGLVELGTMMALVFALVPTAIGALVRRRRQGGPRAAAPADADP